MDCKGVVLLRSLARHVAGSRCVSQHNTHSRKQWSFLRNVRADGKQRNRCYWAFGEDVCLCSVASVSLRCTGIRGPSAAKDERTAFREQRSRLCRGPSAPGTVAELPVVVAERGGPGGVQPWLFRTLSLAVVLSFAHRALNAIKSCVLSVRFFYILFCLHLHLHLLIHTHILHCISRLLPFQLVVSLFARCRYGAFYFLPHAAGLLSQIIPFWCSSNVFCWGLLCVFVWSCLKWRIRTMPRIAANTDSLVWQAGKEGKVEQFNGQQWAR